MCEHVLGEKTDVHKYPLYELDVFYLNDEMYQK